jgi:hypothetical protein
MWCDDRPIIEEWNPVHGHVIERELDICQINTDIEVYVVFDDEPSIAAVHCQFHVHEVLSSVIWGQMDDELIDEPLALRMFDEISHSLAESYTVCVPAQMLYVIERLESL